MLVGRLCKLGDCCLLLVLSIIMGVGALPPTLLSGEGAHVNAKKHVHMGSGAVVGYDIVLAQLLVLCWLLSGLAARCVRQDVCLLVC